MTHNPKYYRFCFFPETPWTMSFFDRDDGLGVTPDGLRCQSRDLTKWHGCRATTGVKSEIQKKFKISALCTKYFSNIQGPGKYYYEATVTDEGLCRVGWSTSLANLDVGTDKYGFGFGGTGKKSNSKQFDNYGEIFGIGDVIGCLLNLTDGEIKFTKNDVDLGVAFCISDSLRDEAFYPAIVLKNAEMSFNFGKESFKHSPPADYIAVCTATAENTTHAGSGVTSKDLKPKPNAPQAIVIEPSRELAEQTFNQIQKFKKHLKDPVVRELLLVGGQNVREQMSTLQQGVDIIVATPGRLEDLISGGYVLLTGCRFFVLDEADGLLTQGHGALIDRLHKQIPKITSDGRRLQMIVCSATLHSIEVKKMAVIFYFIFQLIIK
jgi:ATP-dependent RNA helicase DDX1